MTTAEKLDAMEQLWTSLQTASDIQSHANWHEQVLEERRQRLERGETVFYSLEEVRNRLREQGS